MDDHESVGIFAWTNLLKNSPLHRQRKCQSILVNSFYAHKLIGERRTNGDVAIFYGNGLVIINSDVVHHRRSLFPSAFSQHRNTAHCKPVFVINVVF